MINYINILLYFILSIVIFNLTSCNSIINRLYDDTTAKYNAYFIANEIIDEIELNLKNNSIINYDSLITINYSLDSSSISQYEEKINKSIEKLSILIQRHPESKYVYPSYVLIGKSRLLNLDLRQSIITFKYVNSRSDSKSTKDLALINLMRAYTENQQYKEAEKVYTFLKNKNINESDAVEFHKYAVSLFKILKEDEEILYNLNKIENLSKNRELINKVYFLIGQIHLNNNNFDLAQSYFEKCIKNNPKLEIELFAKLFYIRSSTGSSDDITIEKYFKKLIVDKKNYDFLNKIYFELGRYNYKRERLKKAIENYQIAIEKTKNNKNLLFQAYLEIADMYYFQYQNYSISKLYYDSALMNINRENKNYKELKNKSDVLNSLVDNLFTINKNDSLISLTQLSENKLDNVLDNYIESVKEKKKKKKSEEKVEEYDFYDEDSEVINTQTNAIWYFNNQSMINNGKNEFFQKWGDRYLSDNWRVKSKTIFNEKISEIILEDENKTETITEIEVDSIDKDYLISTLPFSTEDKTILLKEVAKSLFELGKIYIQNLNEIEKGKSIYKEFIGRFPKSINLPDALYQMYLLEDDNYYYKNYIINSFPKSIFAKLIINPDYEIDEFVEYNLLVSMYKGFYEKLLIEKNEYVIKEIDSLEILYKKNEYFENLKLLKSIAKGKKSGNFTLQYELKKFLKNALLKNTSEYANSLLNSAIEVQESFIFSGVPKLKKVKELKFYYIIIREGPDAIIKDINKIINELNIIGDSYIEKFTLTNNKEFYALSGTEFKELKKIEEKFNESFLGKESKVNTNFVIGETNMNIVFQAKSFDNFIKIYNR
jgi:tetratricopeptide (TPR) repeat protein